MLNFFIYVFLKKMFILCLLPIILYNSSGFVIKILLAFKILDTYGNIYLSFKSPSDLNKIFYIFNFLII